MKKENKFTGKQLYSRFAIFFFSTLFLILFGFSLAFQNKYSWMQNVSISLFALFFWGYGFLVGDFSGYFLTKAFKYVKFNYPKYKYIYWILFSLSLIGILFFIGIKVLENKKFWEIFISTGFTAVFGIFLFILKLAYDKYLKKD